jgi:hypothetical protein
MRAYIKNKLLILTSAKQLNYSLQRRSFSENGEIEESLILCLIALFAQKLEIQFCRTRPVYGGPVMEGNWACYRNRTAGLEARPPTLRRELNWRPAHTETTAWIEADFRVHYVCRGKSDTSQRILLATA